MSWPSSPSGLGTHWLRMDTLSCLACSRAFPACGLKRECCVDVVVVHHGDAPSKSPCLLGNRSSLACSSAKNSRSIPNTIASHLPRYFFPPFLLQKRAVSTSKRCELILPLCVFSAFLCFHFNLLGRYLFCNQGNSKTARKIVRGKKLAGA